MDANLRLCLEIVPIYEYVEEKIGTEKSEVDRICPIKVGGERGRGSRLIYFTLYTLTITVGVEYCIVVVLSLQE